MEISRDNFAFILVGPTASGKSTLLKMLREEFKEKITFSISATTRAPRVNEINGVDYYFLSKEEFEEKVQNNEFLEWEPVHTSFYGTLSSEYERANNNNVDLVLDIDIKGAINIKRKLAHRVVFIFLVPPSYEVMADRIRNRAGFKEEDFQNRLKSAKKEYDTFLSLQNEDGIIDYFVVNDKLEDAYNKVRAIYIAESLKLQRLNKKELEKLCTLENL
ncbi:MAG: guanylate kinase [Bdellovibrionota bacterium]